MVFILINTKHFISQKITYFFNFEENNILNFFDPLHAPPPAPGHIPFIKYFLIYYMAWPKLGNSMVLYNAYWAAYIYMA